uniref:Secreted protein n=1 Tax=Romanomermis culicivorax TaxID=13658 RepID=A0A915LER7_ROMCU
MIRSIFALCVFLHYVENHSRLNDFRGSEKQWKADFSSPSSSFSVDSRTQKSIITKKCKGPIAALKIVCKGCYNDMGLSRRTNDDQTSRSPATLCNNPVETTGALL